MKKPSPKPPVPAPADGMRAEYDFSKGVRNKYAKRLREEGYTIRVYQPDGSYTEQQVLGEKTVVLEPDVWEYFPTSETVNEALRGLIALVPAKQKTVGTKAPPRSRPTAKKPA